MFVGIDTGGTFTDIVYADGKTTGSYKLPSTPDDPARAVLEGLGRLFGQRVIERLTYGTTVATNAMLERRGARVALITTAGFEDVIEIGRQNRPELYDLHPVRPTPLVPHNRRFGLRERVVYDGSIERPVDRREVRDLVWRLRRCGTEAVAVCLLHSPVNGSNERSVRDALADMGVSVTLSHELSPVCGEFERSSTTVANAYVRPVVERHLGAIAQRARARHFLVMQSNGGVIGARVAAAEPIRTMLSGPAGGVAAAARCAATLGIERIVTLDMGGTSTDVALVEGRLPRRPDSRIAGLPILTPCIDIHTVGAGGGSIAHLDAGGALKVGPESAGAEPGPACYGKSDEPTVTDANVVLGRLRPELFLGGHMVLDPSRSRRAIARLTRSLGARTVEEAAEGIVRVVEGTMERAIRVITIERGQDPRSCALVAFGGAAGLHACGLADALEIDTVVVPADPGLLSAWGVLAGEVVRDRRRALRLFDPGARALVKESRPLVRAATRDVVGEGLRAADVRAQVWVAVRYRGQSLELEVPLGDDFRRSFDRAHAERFHTCDTARSIEVTGIRATATGHTRTRLRKLPRSRVRSQPSTPVKVWVGGRFAIARLHARESLGARARVFGPAVITEYSSTTFVAPGWRASAQAGGELVVRRVAARRKRLG